MVWNGDTLIVTHGVGARIETTISRSKGKIIFVEQEPQVDALQIMQPTALNKQSVAR